MHMTGERVEQGAVSSGTGRQYRTTDIPTLRSDGAGELHPGDRELLVELYEQTCTTWRMLVDVRFKLLALVPTASLLSLATLTGTAEANKIYMPQVGPLFAVLGLIVTGGLLIYDRRNSELHDDLISRGRKIESELGVHTGVFLGRKVAKGIVKHDNATNLLYGAAIVAWVASIGITGSRLFH
jgi:hypothetical protein